MDLGFPDPMTKGGKKKTVLLTKSDCLLFMAILPLSLGIKEANDISYVEGRSIFREKVKLRCQHSNGENLTLPHGLVSISQI